MGTRIRDRLIVVLICICAAVISLSCSAPKIHDTFIGQAEGNKLINDNSSIDPETPITLDQAIEYLGTTLGNEHIRRGEINIFEPDLGLLKSLSFEQGAEWETTIVMALSDAPELRFKTQGYYLPTSKLTYADLTKDGEADIILLAENQTINVNPIDGYFTLFIFTKQGEQYAQLTMPNLDDTVDLVWGIAGSDNEDSRFPKDTRYRPWFRVALEDIQNYFCDDPEAIERGSIPGHLGTIVDFEIFGSGEEICMLIKQAVTIADEASHHVGYMVNVLSYADDALRIKDKRVFILPLRN